MNYARIAVDPSIHFGQPCVVGTRIPVHEVLRLVEAGIPFETIIEDYCPDITVDDIRACIRYVIDLIQDEKIHLVAPKAS